MIYNSTVNSVNESEFDALLENAEDRFEFETMMEATSIIVAEQEENWTRFMTGVGLSELHTVMEGAEVVYEGARFKSFLDKAMKFFEMAKAKLGELTKRFLAKVLELIPSNNMFVKKYEKELGKIRQLKGEFKGYTFEGLELPKYVMVKPEAGKRSKEDAEDRFVPAGEGSFGERARKKMYGSAEKVTLNDVAIAEQVKILKETKGMRDEAKKSFNAAIKEVNKIIADLKKSSKEAMKDVDDKTLSGANQMVKGYDELITYWKHFTVCTMQYHGTFMGALAARNRQAKTICGKALQVSYDAPKKEDKKAEEKKPVAEGYINTDAFLGAVEFI